MAASLLFLDIDLVVEIEGDPTEDERHHDAEGADREERHDDDARSTAEFPVADFGARWRATKIRHRSRRTRRWRTCRG